MIPLILYRPSCHSSAASRGRLALRIRVHSRLFAIAFLFAFANAHGVESSIPTSAASRPSTLNSQPSTPAANDHYLSLATNAVADLMQHSWTGTVQSGHIVNTWNGYTTNLPDARGSLWERAMFYSVLTETWRLTGDETLRKRLAADWARTKSVYTPTKLQACGKDSGVNWLSDDAGWSALMYLNAYDVTGDAIARTCAQGLVNNAFKRWSDKQLGGGLWYSDERKVKALYQVSLALAALRLYELTRDRTFFKDAFESYNWMETHLLRDDGLYWCEYNASGPVGKERPGNIREASSVVFLGGNMGMALLHARFYRMTPSQTYLDRALRTVNAVHNSKKLVTSAGVYVNDRDAWTEGAFAGGWAREVLVLPGVDRKYWTVLWNTADSIYTKARTADGYYGASWSGPASGPGSVWWEGGSKPEQITTSSSSVAMIVSAAILEREFYGMK